MSHRQIANLYKFLCSTAQGQLVISDSYPATNQNHCYNIIPFMSMHTHTHTPCIPSLTNLVFTIMSKLISTNDFENK